MNLILVFLLSAIAAYGEISFGTASRIRRGAGAPSSGDCAASNDVGKVYIQNDLAASGSPIFACSNSGASSYSWQQASGGGGGGGGATTALDNLASVSINAALIPQSAKNLGAAATPWQSLCLYGSGTFGSHSWCTAGTPTGNRTLTLPDASITVAGSASALTSTRVPFATTGGLLTDSAGLTFTDASNIRLTTLAGGSSQAANALLDITNSAGSSHWLTVLGDGKVGIGTNAPGVPLETTKDLAATAITAAASIVRLNGYAALNRYAGIGYHYSASSASQIPPVWTGVKASLFTGETGADYIIATRSNAAGNASPIERVYVNAAGSIGLGTSNVTPTGISVLDATPASGSTATWIGHDGSGTYSGVHLSALTTTLKVVAGLTQGATNLQEWQGPSGTVLTRIMSTGMLNASDGTQGLQVGAYTGGSGYGAIYLTGTTPGASNYIMVANTTETVFNNPSQITFGVNSQSKMAINTGGLVAFGPVVAFTSGFPALKRSGVGLQVRLADDSAYSTLRASNLLLNNGTIITDTGSGTVQLLNAAADGFTSVLFGLATSSFPALKRSTTGIVARLADDSADTWVQASYVKVTNTAEGACSSTTRGEIRMVQGSTGVADTFRVCAKNAADSYLWTALF